MKVKLILLIMGLFLTGCSEFTVKENTINITDSTSESIDSERINVSQFNGSNFSVLPKNQKIQVTFSKHVDGDTARFSLNGHEFKSRFLLIDTPETVKAGVMPQPFGKEASNRTNELLSNAAVIEVQFDNGDRIDHYQRALCYVYVDGELIQNILASEGLARVAYVYSPNDSLVAEIKGNEQLAKDLEIGIWSIEHYVTKNGFQE
ncbi:thermonuclease family protein [Carnobacterium maltaromaticum]|uniref:thermonuclease family protein n=1 Tax=Carnobacterium maltaromaticum TaxID=2751 RepID=UPI0012FB608E|nr:thermonuclease family protein [Carnobacterium maltaromaticum]